MASATIGCDYGDTCVNESGWWRDGGAFNANATTPIQAAMDNAGIGETVYMCKGSYDENVNVNERLTLAGEGTDAVDVVEHTTNHTASDATGALQLAPLNPDFVAYWESPLGTPGDHICGYIPPPMDLRHLDEIPVKRIQVPCDLPSSFDWRDSGNVTPVKDQDPCGTCWIFGTTSVLESAVLINEGAECNFSEQGVALCVDRSWTYLYDDADDPCGAGGWSWLASEVFIKKGSVPESCNPYNTTALKCDGSCVCDGCAPVKRVDGYRLVTNNGPEIDVIKNAVHDHGPVTMTFYWHSSGNYTNATWGTIYDYYPGPESTNHLVSIIGWNDSVPHPDPDHGGTGAWIVKNSWGTGWGNGGYFYLAYNSSCVQEIAYLEYKDPVPDEELLYWDEAGFVDAAGYVDSNAWVASVFTADQYGNLTHVDFWTTSNNAEYETYVWDGYFGNELANQTGICQEFGYYSIPLTAPIPMDAGQQFTIGVNMSTPGYGYPVAVEYKYGGANPPIQSNVSFVRHSSSDHWMDLADLDWNAGLRARVVAFNFNCTCGDICVNTTGWWSDGGAFNGSGTPIQAAVDNAAAGETICVAAGSYTENVNITTPQLTLAGEGADVVIVTANYTGDHVFEVTADLVNISGFKVTGATGDSKAGIYLIGRQYCNISDNNASGNYNGIYLYSSSNYNTLLNNTADSNSKYSIRLDSSSSNQIYNNYFNNTNNARDYGNNTWNVTPTAGTNIIGGSWLGGNYWSDYAGADENGDGLGDTLTPYNSSGNITYGGDHHPLVMPGFTAPNITSSAPPTPVSNIAGATQTFNITIDQTVNVTWYINGTNVQDTNTSVTAASYTNTSAEIGVWNVSAVAGNANGTDMQTWVWNVAGEITPPAITIDAPTQPAPVCIPGGGQFWVNFTYAELNPKNYTVTVGNATAVINPTTKLSVASGIGMTANESFYLNTSAADGWYNVTVEMYDNSSNYNITHQNNSVEKGSYDAAISQPENQTTEPGANATYELNITNTGDFTGTFTLAVTNHNDAGVAALNATTIANLAVGASQNVTLNVTDASAGTYNVTVNVTSDYSGIAVAETGYIMTSVVGPTLALGNVTAITSDWGINFNLDHSVAVTSAAAKGVNVTYNVSWIEGCAFGTVDKDATEWCNQTTANSTVQEITVKVDATTTTASATNASETFSIDITRRAIIITDDPVAPQSVNPNTTFWINGSAEGKYAETFIGNAYLVRDGSIIENQTTTGGNANFSRTEPAEGTFNFSIRFYNTTYYNNNTTSNATMYIIDDTPPASITGLDNLTTEQSRIHWTWTDPTDSDFAEVMIYLNGTFKTNVSKGIRNYTATGLDPDTNYTIGTHTVDDKGNINQTWENDTARTLPFSGLQRINVMPDSWTMNINESMNFNATGYDHNDDPIDPANLTFAWYTAPSGIGTLNATTGSVVNFTARHAGRAEIYAVNGSVTDSVWITVNALPETKDVTNGTGNATSGNSTAIVNLNNRSVNGTITIEEIGDPINRTEDIGNRTGLGTDSEPIKGVNVTVNGSIKAALNDMGGYVHIRIEYNESQLGDIDENTLYIYKFVNGTGWLKMVKDENPDYCTANGRNTTANHVWANVTNCSIFMLAGTPTAAHPDSSTGSTGGGTYPPGWFGTPTPTVTAAKAPAAPASATDAPPDERVTPAPTKKPAAAKAAAPAAEGTTAGTAKKGAPGFTAVFVIAGLLAALYVMMRRRG
jgi:PGF-CTERM protein